MNITDRERQILDYLIAHAEDSLDGFLRVEYVIPNSYNGSRGTVPYNSDYAALRHLAELRFVTLSEDGERVRPEHRGLHYAEYVGSDEDNQHRQRQEPGQTQQKHVRDKSKRDVHTFGHKLRVELLKAVVTQSVAAFFQHLDNVFAFIQKTFIQWFH